MLVKQIDFKDIPFKTNLTRRLGVISDVHLGHARTPSSAIIASLDKYISNANFMTQIDALFVSGDLFDRLLTVPAIEMDYINDWIKRLLTLSAKLKVPIRVLEGTPSHDWKQPRILKELNSIYNINADIEYYDELSIVYDKSLDMVIGYVPDEWRESCDQTEKEFRDLLATKGYSQVDVLVMHGMFEFQIPKAAAKSVSHFVESGWEPLVRHAIIIGHDHRHKHSGIIVVPGSWERLSHNEEGPKGGLIVDICQEGVFVYHLINQLARLYLTVDGVSKTDIEVIAEVEEKLKQFAALNHPEGRLRVKYSRHYDLTDKLIEWKNAFLDVIVEGSSESEKTETVAELEKSFKLENGAINIHKDNILGMILREVDVSVDESERIKNEVLAIQEMVG